MKRWMTPPPDATHIDALLRLTLIELLLRPAGPWGVRPLILALAGVGLIATPVLRTPLTWFVLSLLPLAALLLFSCMAVAWLGLRNLPSGSKDDTR